MGSEMLDACQEMDRMEDYLRYRTLSCEYLTLRITSSSEALITVRGPFHQVIDSTHISP